MLPPDSRVTLLERLEPPPGYVVTHVVGTTYTVDLDSALLPSLALSRSASAATADPLETIAAVQASIDKIDVFHQRGMIAVPTTRSRLHTLLEPALHAVQHSRSFLFHPKVWVARYQSETTDDVTVRMVVMSRNLSKGRSWDIALTLDGVLGTAPDAKNKPIADLLRYLAGSPRPSLSDERADRVRSLGEDLRRVRWEMPSGASDIDFHVFGIPGARTVAPDFSGYKHLLVTPFLQDDGLQTLAQYAKNNIAVVSRQESFDGLSADIAQWIEQPYVLSPTAGIPADDQESTGGPALSGLHAKMYCVERARKAHLFIGSANATRNAFHGNVEILVELTGQTGVFGVEALLGKGGFSSILQSTTIDSNAEVDEDPQTTLDNQLGRLVFDVQLRAELAEVDEHYVLHLTSHEPVAVPEGAGLAVSLLTVKSSASDVTAGAPIDVAFDDLRLSDVTALFVLTLSGDGGRTASAVVMAELVNDVADRMSAIVTREISSPDAFRRFLSLLLAFGAPGAAPGEADEGEVAPGSSRWSSVENGLFEQLLRVSPANSQVLEHLAGVVTSIIGQGDPHGVLPDGFRDLWSAIYSVTAKEEKVHA
ncbi:phospholipase D family protein [Rhodococcus sp. SORGH_AS_0303]|uniref:phospholipase D family protein n=1 Tax=Rhodococcus sp. SORGH_AS_0303 TaxID=3041753 RepID=UPI0027853B42|nr:phospholipase D family protein [Rhodococcus sp. SORGH_AS_0303]MDQ1200490.1 hypothetical protein [Rhodococcus sp. SORGH_AS_0303]